MGSSTPADHGANNSANNSADDPVGSNTPYDLPLEAADRTAVLDAIAQKITAEYAFPDIAQTITADIQSRIAADGYQDIKSGAQLAATLTAQLSRPRSCSLGLLFISRTR